MEEARDEKRLFLMTISAAVDSPFYLPAVPPGSCIASSWLIVHAIARQRNFRCRCRRRPKATMQPEGRHTVRQAESIGKSSSQLD